MFTCSVCGNKEFNDPEDFASHLISSEHRDHSADSENSAHSFELGPSCDKCEMKFSGIVPYRQHMGSKKHKKKIEHLEYLARLKSENTANDLEKSSNTEKNNLNSPIPDNSCAKKEEINDEPFAGEAVALPKQKWQCNVCRMLFPDNETFDEHFMKEAHANNLRKCNELKTKMQFDNPSNVACSSTKELKFDDSEEDFQQFLDTEHSPSSSDSACSTSMPSGDVAVGNSVLQNLGNISDNENKFFCSVCKISCTGFIPYTEHVASKKHKKEQEKQKLLLLCNNALTKSYDGIQMPLNQQEGEACSSQNKGVIASSIMGESNNRSMPVNECLTGDFNNPTNNNLLAFENTFECPTCNIFCTGIIPYQQHLYSQKHAKELEKKKILEQFMKSTDSISGIDSMNNSLEIPSAECSSVTIPVIHSTPQKESAANTDAVVDLISFEESSSDPLADKSSFNTANEITCDVCNIKCSGIIPFTQHMRSTKHKKMVESKKLLQTNFCLIENETNPEKDFEAAFTCHLCKVSCSGHIAYEQHLESLKHYKMLKRTQIMEQSCWQLQETKIDENTSSKSLLCGEWFPHDDNNTSNSANNDSLETSGISGGASHNVLKCSYCKTSFSGIIPFNQHMTSNKHKRQIEKCKMLKSFKELQNQKLSASKSFETYSSMGARAEVETRSSNDSGNEEMEESIAVIGQLGCEKCGIEEFTNETSRKEHFQSKEHLEDENVEDDSAFESFLP